MRFYRSRFGISTFSEVAPEEIRDAVSTLRFSRKVVIDIDAPGLGPETLVNWAFEELHESSVNKDVASRKAFSAAVLAKTATECLLDWYLNSSHIGATVRQHAGTEEKLKALDAERWLKVGPSLFRDVLFAPRNRAIHDYESVDPKESRHACELARLFIHGAMAARCPKSCCVYYGELELARGEEARRICGLQGDASVDQMEAFFYFGGFGPPGKHGVLLPRGPNPLIVLIESQDEGDAEARVASLRKFSPDLLREVFAILEKNRPVPYELEKHERDYLLRELEVTESEETDDE